jgi:hypothetical protein
MSPSNFEVTRSKRYPTINGEEEEVTVPAAIDNLCSYQHCDNEWYLLGGQSQNAWIGTQAFDVVQDYFLPGNSTDRHVILRYR